MPSRAGGALTIWVLLAALPALTTALLTGLLLILALLATLLAAALLARFLLAALLLARLLLVALTTLATLIFIRHFYLFLRLDYSRRDNHLDPTQFLLQNVQASPLAFHEKNAVGRSFVRKRWRPIPPTSSTTRLCASG